MGKQKRSRGVHTAVVLPPDMLEQLRRSERGVSEEIRRRLALTFEQDAADPITRELHAGLANIATQLKQDFGTEWHTMQRPYEAFVAAVVQRLANYKPPQREEVAATDLLFAGPDGPPETIGRLRESDDRRAHPYPHLEVAQRRRSPLRSLHIRAKKEGDK